MSIKKTINSTLFVFSLILLLIGTLTYSSTAVYSQEPDGNEEPEPIEQDFFRKSDSPHMYLSDEMLSIPPAQPSANVIMEDDPTIVNEVVVYNVQTKEVSTTPITQESAPSSEAAPSAAPYQGLLPVGVSIEDAIEQLNPPETVIGTDDRSRINNTAAFPWRTVVRLYVTYPSNNEYICSGAIISNFHVLTAGHCVYDHDENSWASTIRVVPGQDDDYTPYGSAWSTYMRSYTGWTQDQNWNHDWAVITLDRNIGNFTGWMGRQTADSSSSIYNGSKNVAGYPGDLGSGCCMYWDADVTHSTTSEKHYYYMDTAGGMSGGPVWRYTDGNRYILSVHAYGFNNSSAIKVNSGTRLNQDKYDRIDTWIGSDSAPTDKPDLIDDGLAYSAYSPSSLSKGASFSVYNDVRNIGTASSGAFDVLYYASTNTTISSADYLIGTDVVSSINPFSYRDASFSGSFPSNIPPGTYYVGWIIDGNGDASEFDESNNTAYETTLLTVRPSTPTNITASDGSSQSEVQISWNNVSEADTFRVYRATSINGAKTQLGTTSNNSFVDTTVVPGTIYYYFVQARGNSINSLMSSYNSGYAILATPSSIEASSGTYTETINISWESVPEAAVYELYRAESASDTPALLTTTSETLFEDDGTDVATIYYYSVKACKNTICSEATSHDEGHRSLLSPIGIEATNNYTESIQVSWDATTDADSYNVYRATQMSGRPQLLDTISNTVYIDTDNNAAVTYYYSVTACKNLLCSGPSEIVDGTRQKKSQSITAFAVASDRTDDVLYRGEYAMSATASSGMPVAIASSTPDVCTVANNVLSVTATGVCTVTASQSGDAEFLPAESLSSSYQVQARLFLPFVIR